eukprot:COSAG06_NODE_9980_length_1775_cov_38.735680_1_plen_139_part_00
MSICFNTVAILFVAEVDNALFVVLLPERVRARIEDRGRVELGDGDAEALARTKLVHTVLILLAVLIPVWLGASDISAGTETALLFPFLAFWAGGVAETLGAGRSGAEVCKAIGLTTVATLFGFIGFVVLVSQSGFDKN